MGNLLAARIIHSPVFGLKFSDKVGDASSRITIGDYDRSLVGGDKIYWEKNIGTNRWKFAMKGLSYGEKKMPVANDSWIGITTGESHLRFYRPVFDNIAVHLRSKWKCSYMTEEPLFYCFVSKRNFEQFEVIEIHLGNIIIYVEPNEYIRFVPHSIMF